MASVAKRYESVQYDGTNGSVIAGTWNTVITFVSDDGSTFVFRDGDNGEHSVSVGDWVVQQGGVDDAFPSVESASSYADRWVEVV